MTARAESVDRRALVVVLVSAVLGATVAWITADVILGVALGAGFYAVATRVAKAFHKHAT